jgi:hypothetical protein
MSSIPPAEPEAPGPAQTSAYRAGGGDDESVPFPRKNMRAWIFVTAALSVAAAVAPPFLLGDDRAHVGRTMHEGGWFMSVILFLELGCPALVCLLGARVIRGRKTPAVAVAGIALVPSSFAFAATLVERWRTSWALEHAVEAGTQLRVALQAVSELEANLQYGALASAFALLASAAVATGAVAAIDVARVRAVGDVARVHSSQARSRSVTFAAAISMVATLAAVAYVLVTKCVGTALRTFEVSLLASFAIAALAAFATRAAGALGGSHDRVEARRMAGALVVAALASALGLFLLDCAILLAQRRSVFSAASGDTVDASTRARILYEWLFTSRAYKVVVTVHVAGALGAFIPALVRARAQWTHPVSVGARVATAISALVVVGFAGLAWSDVALIRRTAADEVAREEPSVALPRVDSILRLRPPIAYPEVLVRGLPIRGYAAGRPVTISADRALTAGDLADALDASDLSGRFVTIADGFELRVVGSDETDAKPRLPDPALSELIGRDEHVVRGLVVLAPGAPPGAVHIRIDSHDSLFVDAGDGRTLVLDTTPGFDRRLQGFARLYGRATADEIFIDARRDTSIESLARVLAAVDIGWGMPHVNVSQ